jgi:hypothetical protein
MSKEKGRQDLGQMGHVKVRRGKRKKLRKMSFSLFNDLHYPHL